MAAVSPPGSRSHQSSLSTASKTGSRSAQEPASGELFYLYCLLRDDDSAVGLLEQGVIEGMEPGRPVFPVRSSGLVAALSRVPDEKFNSTALNETLQGLSSVTPLAARHNSAVNSVHEASASIVPVTVGAVFSSLEPVERLLAENYSQINMMLDRVSGCQEWGVKVFEDPEKLSEAACAESPELRELDAEIAKAAPGRAFLLKKRREQSTTEAARKFRDARHGAMLEQIREQTVDLRLDRVVQSPEASAILTLKAACLVNRSRAGSFHETVSQVKENIRAAGLDLQVTGPWAPYSFVDSRDLSGRGDY